MIASVQRGYSNATRVLGIVTAALGVALLAGSLARGGGPLAVGVVVGAAFIFVGVARFYLAGRGHTSPLPRNAGRRRSRRTKA